MASRGRRSRTGASGPRRIDVSALTADDGIDEATTKKVRALQSLHAQKTRALMKSIDGYRKQIAQLKSQNSQAKRTEMIKTLKNEKREQELVVAMLKEELSVAKSQSAAEIDKLVIKRTTGGPKRFRPKTREELAMDVREL